MDDMTVYFAVVVPLAIIIMIALILYRVFSNSAKKDKKYLEETKRLEELKEKAEFRAAKIISVQPYQASIYAPGMRTVNVRLEIEVSPGDHKMYSCKWFVDDFFASSYQSGDNIQVKVIDEYIFPTAQGAKLLPE